MISHVSLIGVQFPGHKCLSGRYYSFCPQTSKVMDEMKSVVNPRHTILSPLAAERHSSDDPLIIMILIRSISIINDLPGSSKVLQGG